MAVAFAMLARDGEPHCKRRLAIVCLGRNATGFISLWRNGGCFIIVRDEPRVGPRQPGCLGTIERLLNACLALPDAEEPLPHRSLCEALADRANQ